ncbi:Uncharacterised protein [Vibrio cholerae]|nr:Uncharacterised protein [Vibrio cholerae]CSC38581.1 Uncharacterised protein [Vibrio cholerae]
MVDQLAAIWFKPRKPWIAGVLGKHCASQTKGAGIISNGQINPAVKISGMELINTTKVTSSRLGVTAPNAIPTKLQANKNGKSKLMRSLGFAKVFTPCKSKLAPK